MNIIHRLHVTCLVILCGLILFSACSSNKDLLLDSGPSNTLQGNAGTIVDELRLTYDEDNTVANQIGATVSENGKQVAFAYDNGTVKIIDLTKGRAIKSLKVKNSDLFEIRFNYDGTKLIVAGNNREVQILDIQSGGTITEIKLPQILNRIAVSKADDLVAFGIKKGLVHIYDLTANKKLHELDAGKHMISGLDFDPNGKAIAVTALRTWGIKKKNPIKIFDLQSGKVIDNINTGRYTGLSYLEDGSQLLAMGIKGIFDGKTIINTYNFKTKSINNIQKKSIGSSISFFTSAAIYDNLLLTSTTDQTFDVIDLNTGGKVYTTDRDKFKGIGLINRLATDQKRIYPLYDGKNFLINYSDNNINQIYNAETNSISAFIYSDANKDFAVVARDGRMEGNSEAIANVAWSQRKSNKRVPLEATFDRFYTPNLLQSLLSGDVGEQNVASLEKAIEFSPLVEIVRPDSMVTTDKDQLSITVKGTPQGDEIKELKVFVNGKPLGGDQRGLKISDGNTQTFTIPLLPGRSIISAVAVSEGGYQSAPDRIIADYQGQTDEANLHILAVGIDNYKNSSYNLNYATADASALIEEIQNKAGDIFSDVKITYIKNKEATKEKIQQAVESIQAQSRLQDVFLFYYAGHGVMSEGTATIPSDFYLALHDVTSLYGNDNMLKEKGVSAAELRDIFSNMPPRKQLIVLDACQSGGAVETFAMRGAAEEKAMIQLARSSGVVLLASTGSEQFATEFAELGHGVFTYSILQGLNGQADSGDNKVTVKELEAFLNDSVPELTEQYKGMAQYPRSWSRGMDFPIGVINE